MKLIKFKYLQYFTYVIFCLCLLIYILEAAKLFLAPLMLALFVSIALFPFLRFIQRWIKSNLWSTVTLLVAISTIFGGIGLLIFSQLKSLRENSDQLYTNIQLRLKNIEKLLEEHTAFDFGDIENLIEDNQGKIIDSGSETAFLLADNFSNLLFYLVTIPLYTFFLLYYYKALKLKIYAVLSSFQVKYKSLTKDFSTLIQQYLKGMIIVMLIVGVLNSIGLWALSVPYAFLLGFMVAAFSIVPYVGMIAGGILVLFVSYVTQGSLSTLAWIILLLGVVQLIEGNFITPYIVGNKVNVNLFVAILALLAGGQIWGVPGMILAIPSTAAISILIKQLQNKVFFTPS